MPYLLWFDMGSIDVARNGSRIPFNNRDNVKSFLTLVPARTREPDGGHFLAAFATGLPHI